MAKAARAVGVVCECARVKDHYAHSDLVVVVLAVWKSIVSIGWCAVARHGVVNSLDSYSQAHNAQTRRALVAAECVHTKYELAGWLLW